jgi:hypothetical protein
MGSDYLRKFDGRRIQHMRSNTLTPYLNPLRQSEPPYLASQPDLDFTAHPGQSFEQNSAKIPTPHSDIRSSFATISCQTCPPAPPLRSRRIFEHRLVEEGGKQASELLCGGKTWQCGPESGGLEDGRWDFTN